MVALLGADGYLYSVAKAATVSYAAHVGGLVVGALMGACVLDTLETSDLHRWVVGPLAFTLAALLPACMAAYCFWAWRTGDFPPPALASALPLEQFHSPENCCAQLLHCPGVDPADYATAFYCPAGDELYKNSGAGDILVQGCDALVSVAAEFAE